MTRLLDFKGPKGPMRFELCYIAILSAGDQKGPRDRYTIRKEARLLDVFDSISIGIDGVTENGSPRVLMDLEYMQIELEQDDFSLLSDYADRVPWTPKSSREAVDMQDFLSASGKFE